VRQRQLRAQIRALGDVSAVPTYRVCLTSPAQANGMCSVLSLGEQAANRGDMRLKTTYVTLYERLLGDARAEGYLTERQATVLAQSASTLWMGPC
jgi:hypothetical protein